MKMLKKLFAVAAIATGVALPALAQSSKEEARNYKPFPHIFVGVQGGGQTTLTNYDNLKLITPTASVSAGAWFTPAVGARLHFNGFWNQGALKNGTKYDYKYLTSDFDVMLNMVTLFGKKDYYPLNVYLIGGIGLNTGWDNDDAYALRKSMPMAWKNSRLSHNARVGAQVDYNICKNLSVNLEVAANSLSDRYNSKVNEKDDWQLTAQIGIAVKFGHKKRTAIEDAALSTTVENYVETVDTEQAATTTSTEIKPVKKEEVVPEVVEPAKPVRLEESVFFGLNKDAVTETEMAKVKEFVKFLNEHPNAKVTLTGYADKGTGTASYNKQISSRRVRNVVNAFKKLGISESRIVFSHKGDTEQPYAENDKNRVVIGIAEE